MKSATAFAPATVANVAVGFDVLGFAMAGVGDRATVTQDPTGRGVRIASITGRVTDLPKDPERNTASVALLAMLREHPLPGGLSLALDKGIPLGSGMGGSAASAVAAVVAANALLERPLEPAGLLPYALAGERAATGAAHADNVAPCLLGGLTAVVGLEPPRAVSLPVPDGLTCVLVHPHLEVETRSARAVIEPTLPLERHAAQSMRLCGFLAGCFANDLELLGRSMVDLIAEPYRAPLIPGFAAAKRAAAGAGALGFGISGSGPSVFAFSTGAVADRVATDVRRAFRGSGHETDVWIGPVSPRGAAVEAGD